MIWDIWWVWLSAALVLAIIEVAVPGFIFLGFAIGAAVVGLLIALGLSLSFANNLLVFALVSVVAWVVLRRVIGVRRGQKRTFNHDINED